MFKKPFAVGGSHKASGGDRKKLRKSLEKAFNCNEEQLDLVIPLKLGELEVAKVAAPSKTVIYLLDKVPIMVDPNGKGDYIPTTFALWKAPTLVPRVFLKHPLVSEYIVNGADLMIPGVLFPPEGLEPFKAGGVVSVCSPGNPCPIAVGVATMSHQEAASRKDNRGKLVELIQHYGDHLWSDLGAGATPNEGFQGTVVMALEGAEGVVNEEDGGEDGIEREESGEVAGLQDRGATSSEVADGLAGVELTSPGGESTSAKDTPEDMEQLLEMCLLQALHKSVKDSELPLNPSLLWNQHMLPARPQGCSLDVKKSKHKKMSKFLQVYTRLGLIKTREDKHSGDFILTSVNRTHDLYTDFRPYKTSTQISANTTPDTASTSGPSTQASAPTTSTSATVNQTELLIETVYKPTREVKPVFEALGLSPDGVYSVQESGTVPFDYVRAAQLEDPNSAGKDTVLLDPLLCDALFKGVINTKKGERFPTHVHKSQLRELFCNRLQTQFRVVRPGMPPLVKKGQVQPVQISLEKRQGNKKVTRVIGLETFLVDPYALGQECQKKFASNTSVSSLPGKNQPGMEMVIQGGMADAVADHLIRAYGIPSKYVNVTKKA